MNYMLAIRLFQDRAALNGGVDLGLEAIDSNAELRAALYERKLLSLEVRKRRQCHSKMRAARARPPGIYEMSVKAGEYAESEEEEEAHEDEEIEVTQDETAASLTDMQVKCKPNLSEMMEAVCRENVLKDPEQKAGGGGAELLLQEVDPEPKFNLLQILQENGNLSKVQARRAFSAYLHRVQLRLMKEAGDQIHNAAWAAKEDEQMELVIRFLKRAASNLQQSFRMLLPSRRLALDDRRHILAHQLGEFIVCYNKETEQMIQTRSKRKQEEEGVNAEGFQDFVTKASESDLEEVLTFYTHKNKSASVFLGTNPRTMKPSSSINQSESRAQGGKWPLSSTEDEAKLLWCNHPRASSSVPGATLQRSISSQLSSHATASKNTQVPGHHSSLASLADPKLTQSPPSPPSFQSQSTIPDNWSVSTNPVSHQTSNHAGLHRCRSGSYTIGPFSSFQSATQIYSQRLSRPSSAKAGECAGGQRVGSARVHKDAENSSSQSRRYNHSIVAAELQRLAEKQATRQYSPPSHISLLTQQLTNLNLARGAVSRGNTAFPLSHRSVLNTGGSMWAVQPDTSTTDSRVLKNDSFAWEGELENCVHSKVTGSQLAHPKHQPTAGSYQLHFAVQQLQQQKLQSRQLLEQSRARHQALFANHPPPSSANISMPADSGARKTSSATSSIQKATSSHKVMPSQSTSSHLVPKPPANHRQAVVRKVAAQRISK
uniref:Tubulin tyrosine ligase like 5 n=1 Tax=Chelonoidis abingdonii TaxID=106734 RepID=A0A8C0JEK1_CHEAB